MAATSTRALGAGDCEAWRDGPLGQPTNALSSGAYVLAGLWLLRRARRARPGQRWRASGHGLLLAASGLGSIAYHGRGGPVSHWLHDVTLAGLLASLPAEQLATGGGARAGGAREPDVGVGDGTGSASGPTTALGLWALGTAPAALHLALRPEASTPSTAALVGATTVGEVRRWRGGGARVARAHRPLARRRTAVAVGAVAAGLATYALGRTGASTCRPDSRWQWHAAWHVLGAVGAAAWSDRVHVLPHLDDGTGPGR